MAAEPLLAWWAWIAPVTLQATALLALAWAADRFGARRAWPQILATLWWLALARLCLPATLASPVSVTGALGASTLEAAETPVACLPIALFTLWLVGAAGVLASRVRARRSIARRLESVASLRADWTQAFAGAARAAGVRRTPRVAVLDGLGSPAVFGALQPVLLLPRDALARRPGRADRHALLHELVHVRRRDLAADELRAVLCALFWFHPLVWIASRRLHALSEIACDQQVARALGREAASYRQTLLDAASEWLAPRRTPAVHAFLGHPAAILVRLEHLERAATPSLARIRAASSALALACAACVLPMAPNAPTLREQALRVFEQERDGALQSCFTLQAAALVLAERSQSPTPTPR